MTLNKLKEQYDRVIITHNKDVGSRVVLVDGLKMHVGHSMIHSNDTFNRRLGRTIAQGRAEYASKVASGDSTKRKTGLSYTVTCGDVKELDEKILELFKKEA